MTFFFPSLFAFYSDLIWLYREGYISLIENFFSFPFGKFCVLVLLSYGCLIRNQRKFRFLVSVCERLLTNSNIGNLNL